jgi:hypothetical protein
LLVAPLILGVAFRNKSVVDRPRGVFRDWGHAPQSRHADKSGGYVVRTPTGTGTTFRRAADFRQGSFDSVGEIQRGRIFLIFENLL